MTQEHPITIPPELVEQLRKSSGTWLDQTTNAYRAGADMELDACCEWLDDTDCEDPAAALQEASLRLRWHRRPKPPSLKKQALAALQQVGNCEEIDNATFETIRRALETLDD